MKNKYTIIITRGKIAYVAYCEELGIASQGKTVAKAKANIREAISLYLEEAKDSAITKDKLPILTTVTVG